MILPIIAYGDPVLKKRSSVIEEDYAQLNSVVDNMFESMYNAKGVGLAAPQIGLLIRLFIIDTDQLEPEDDEEYEGIKRIFINPVITEFNGEPYAYNEGCLSIPTIREDVMRPEQIQISYYDQDFNKHTEEFDSINARVIQHEYDHLDGILFTDKLMPLKKRLLKTKLEAISKGKISVDYKMKFPAKK